MVDPVFVDGVTPLNSVNLTKLQTRDEKNQPNGYLGNPAGGIVNGQWLKGVGGAAVWAPLPGEELAYAENTTSTIAITGTTEATATTVVTAVAVTFDGTTVALVEYFAQALQPGATAGQYIALTLFDNGVAIGMLGVTQNPVSGGMQIPFFGARRLTPSAASHQFSVRAWGNGSITSGTGGTSTSFPTFIRVTRV